jgi:hypothetical protein
VSQVVATEQVIHLATEH